MQPSSRMKNMLDIRPFCLASCVNYICTEIRMLYLRVCWIREDNSLKKVVMSVSSQVRLLQEIIAVYGLPLNVEFIISWILSMLFRNSKIQEAILHLLWNH